MTTYKDAGVNLSAAEETVRRIKRNALTTPMDNVLAHVGGFAGCYELPTGYTKPVLVTSTDGIGTKLLLALQNQEWLISIGQDLVAMVVNDIVCCGAKPLFLLDYFATSKLDPAQADTLIGGVAHSCRECNIALIGGETAEMPGLYKPGDFDIAGFAVGIVEKDQMIDGHAHIKNGDAIIGIESSGPHSNGYSLIRKIINMAGDVDDDMMGKIMEPTYLYTNVVLDLMTKVQIKGVANITGGGFTENIPRIVDSWWHAKINADSWDHQEVFKWLQETGDVTTEEMYNVFNMGIGMVLVVSAEEADTAISTISENGLKAWKIGETTPRDNATIPQVIY